MLSLVKLAHTVIQPTTKQGSYLQHEHTGSSENNQFLSAQDTHSLHPQMHGSFLKSLACKLTRSAV